MRESLVVKLQDLPASGWHWHTNISRSSLEDAARGEVDALSPLCSDAHWYVDLQRKGDCYHLRGHWRVQARRRCSRCNVKFELDMSGQTVRDFRISDIASGEDSEVLQPPGHIDMLDVLREDIWLAWPPVAICTSECKGLCPNCGKDLNEGACSCHVQDDTHPFTELRKLKLDQD